ncbi:MAG: SHD1 domain-containing protein [Planctomycetota bacterium]
MNRFLSFTIILMVIYPFTVQAEERTFSDASGNYSVEAELVDYQGGEVHLRKTDGTVVTVALKLLSQADQEYVRSHADAGPTVRPLRETLTNMVEQLTPGSSEPGTVVKVSGDRVYINRGAKDGSTEGAEYDIVRGVTAITDPSTGEKLGEDRDVVGRIRVVSVQEKMSICELVDGEAEQKNSEGEFNEVLPAETGGMQASIGRIELNPEAGVSEEEVTQGLAAACKKSGKINLGDAFQSSKYELRLSGEASGGAVDLTLLLIDSSAGRELGRARGTHKTGLSLAELDYKSALTADLGVSLKIEPVHKALERKFGTVQQAGDVFFVKNAGPRNEDVWIFPDSRIVVAAKRELSDSKQCAQLALAWTDISRTLAGVVADVKEEGIQDRLKESSQIFTLEPNQFQGLYVSDAGTVSGWVLNWPDAKPSWAALIVTGSGNRYWPNKAFIDEEVRVENGTNQPAAARLTDLQYGEHSLSIEQHRAHSFEIRAFFADPNGRMTLYDKSNKPMASREVFSKVIDEVVVPVAQ